MREIMSISDKLVNNNLEFTISQNWIKIRSIFNEATNLTNLGNSLNIHSVADIHSLLYIKLY